MQMCLRLSCLRTTDRKRERYIEEVMKSVLSGEHSEMKEEEKKRNKIESTAKYQQTIITFNDPNIRKSHTNFLFRVAIFSCRLVRFGVRSTDFELSRSNRETKKKKKKQCAR